jgi:hypothetical protein
LQDFVNAHARAYQEKIDYRPGILRSRRILNHAKPSITAGGMKILLGIQDLFGTELAMIFSFHVGLTDSVMQRMQFFFCQCLFDIFLPPHCQIYYFNIRKKPNDLLSV